MGSSITTSGAAPSSTGTAVAGSAGSAVLIAGDGRHLAASWAEPAAHAGQARAVAVISSAAGVPRGYYRAFAEWLAARGYAVLTYDYRGIGGSRRGAVRDETATMKDWAVLDMSAALEAAHARRTSQGLPLLLIGHSFGGNCISFARGIEHADAILTVGSQLGEPRLYPGVHRLASNVFFRALVPGAVALWGHVPGWALGGAEPMPGPAALQWGRWALRRGWAFAAPEMQAHRSASAVIAPVHLWNISDDLTFAPPAAVDALAAQFRNAAMQRHTLRPADVGRDKLGHFGAFRREPGARLWDKLLTPIEAAAPALRIMRRA